MKSYTCLIHRPENGDPQYLAVSCAGVERAIVHAERVARQWDDWRVIEVFEGQKRVATRERSDD